MVSKDEAPSGKKTVVPTGPPNLGPLAYQEPWAYERRMPGRGDLLLVTGIVTFGTIILLVGLAIALEGNLPLAAIYFGASLLLLVGSVDLINKLRHSLPFRVYARGVVLPPKEPERRYREGEHFVPFDKVTTVEVKEDEWKGGAHSFLRFTVLNDLGEEDKRIVYLATGVTVAPIVEALKATAPGLEVEQVV